MDKNTRLKCNSSPIEIKIGNSHIKQEKSAKLLGIVFNDKQNWTTQIRGQNGVVSGLNKRLFAIKRLKNYINKTSLTKVVDGLFTSKINYGVQLYGKVRLTPDLHDNSARTVYTFASCSIPYFNLFIFYCGRPGFDFFQSTKPLMNHY